MSHILYAAHPTVGHTSALRAIGAELRARGHATSFAIVRARVPFASLWPEPVRAASNLPAAIAAEGAEVLELAASPASLWHAARLPRATGQAELEIALALFTSSLEAQAREIAEYIRRTGAAVVVGDYLMPAALLAARLAERPFIAFYHSALPFPAEGAPPFGTILPESARGGDAWRAVLDSLPLDRRNVYVSLGTVFNGQPAVFRSLIPGAAAAGVHVVVSAGASFEALADLHSPSVHIHRRVPQVPFLERVDAVVTHGGEQHRAGVPRGGSADGGDPLRRGSGRKRASGRTARRRRAHERRGPFGGRREISRRVARGRRHRRSFQGFRACARGLPWRSRGGRCGDRSSPKPPGAIAGRPLDEHLSLAWEYVFESLSASACSTNTTRRRCCARSRSGRRSGDKGKIGRSRSTSFASGNVGAVHFQLLRRRLLSASAALDGGTARSLVIMATKPATSSVRPKNSASSASTTRSASLQTSLPRGVSSIANDRRSVLLWARTSSFFLDSARVASETSILSSAACSQTSA
jgi:hypothetical protein